MRDCAKAGRLFRCASEAFSLARSSRGMDDADAQPWRRLDEAADKRTRATTRRVPSRALKAYFQALSRSSEFITR